MTLNHLLEVGDLTTGDLEIVLDLAADLKARPHSRHGLLADEIVGCYFSKPSTRTRVSFAVAIRRLGGIPEPLGPDDLQLGRGETIEDTARVLSSYLRAFVIRTFAHDKIVRFAEASGMPVVNALTDAHHPCQALADLMTLRERHGSLAGLRIAYLGDGNNVAHSLMQAGALAGMHVVIGSPAPYEPSPVILRDAQEAARATGGSVKLTNDPHKAVADADAVYTDVWLSMGDSEETRETRFTLLEPFRVDAALMALAKPNAVFMHCLPAHRGEEVAANVIDGPHSIVFDQAANRVCTEQAVLVALLEGRLRGQVHEPLTVDA
jgi:ornithine carbamoyltransferase